MTNIFTDLILNIRNSLGLTEKYVYIAIGDSTVEGIGTTHKDRSFPALIFAQLKQEHKNTEFHNLGKSGAKVKDVVEYQLERVCLLNPNLITVSVGGNDLRSRTKLKDFENNFSYLIEQLKMRTNAMIVVNNIPDLSHLKIIPIILRPLSKLMLIRINKAIEKIAKKYQVIHIDLYTQSKIFAKNYPEFISEDKLHPSDSGYALWANTINTYLKHILNK